MTIVAPDAELFDRAVHYVRKFRTEGLGGDRVRKDHYNAVLLHDPTYKVYEMHVWGDPAGHVRAYAYRTKK
jgi:hypothetical protein